MDLSDFDALSFDCYGTLIDWERGLSVELERWGAAHGWVGNTADLLDSYSRFESSVQAAEPSALYPDVLAGTMRAVGAHVGIEVTDDDAQRIGASVPDWPAFPDSAEALAHLAERYQLIILSNIDRVSFAASTVRLGVTFAAIVTAQDVGSYKPDPRNFRALLATAAGLGVGEGRLLHVAQSLFHDHVPAQAIGLPTVWINRRAGQAGSGATPEPSTRVTPNWEFPTMKAFAEACG